MISKILEAPVEQLTPSQLENFKAGNAGEWDVRALREKYSLQSTSSEKKEISSAPAASQAQIQRVLSEKDTKTEMQVQERLRGLWNAENPRALYEKIRDRMEDGSLDRVTTCAELLQTYPTPDIAGTMGFLARHAEVQKPQKLSEVAGINMPDSTYRVYGVIALASGSLRKREGYVSQDTLSTDVEAIKTKFPNPMDFYRATYDAIESRIQAGKPADTPTKQSQYKLALEVATWAIYGESRIKASVQMENYLNITYQNTARSKLEGMVDNTDVSNYDRVPIETFRDYLRISIDNLHLSEKVDTEVSNIIRGFNPAIARLRKDTIANRVPPTEMENRMMGEVYTNGGNLTYATMAEYLRSCSPKQNDQSEYANTRREALGVVTNLMLTVQKAQQEHLQHERVDSIVSGFGKAAREKPPEKLTSLIE